MQYVELRHINNIKGNMAISETEYVATAKLDGEAKPITQTIYSNVKAIIEQNRYFFENLWINAITAKKRITKIEAGKEPNKTEIIENRKEISKRIIDLAKQSNELRIYSTIGGMRLIYNDFFEIYKDVIKNQRNGKHEGIKWITSIYNKQDIEIVTIFLNEGINVHHVKSVPFSSFALSNKMLNSTIEKMDKGKMVTNLLSSNDVLYRNHYNAIFKELWKVSIDASNRIKDIEEGRYINVEVLPNPKESIKWVSELNKTAKEEILILLSSENGLLRTERTGGLDLLNELAAKGIKSMIFEIKDDSKYNFQQALGLAIYIEGKSTALSYISIFDSLWKQTELFERLKQAFIQLQIHEKMQKDFINTAAHELRTPLQPILGFSEHIRNKANDKEQIELLDIIIKNTKKLKKLSDDILDVSKIESNSFKLNKDRFALDILVLDIIKEFEHKSYNDKKIKFEYYRDNPNQEYILYGDKNRIGQVIFNLISNSIKFISKGGKIIIIIEKAKSNYKNRAITVTIKDTGIGIDDEIYPNLFTKFVTKSFQGTGLGLYISKNIIEAHGGKIWGENNKDGKGATFGFRLPIKNRPIN